MKKETRRLCGALLAALLSAGLWAPQAAGRQKKGLPNRPAQQQAAPGAGQTLSRGKFLLDNNDTSDEAARLFRQVAEWHPGSREAEAAQFFLGTYYQRKFQIKAQRGEHDRGALDAARGAYEEYVRRYPNGGPCECLADAYFNLALVNMQLGDGGVARYNLSKLREAAGRDPYVYVYQVSWSGSQKDVIDAHFPSERLAAYTYELTGYSFEQAAPLLRRWCMSEKSRVRNAARSLSAAPRREA